MSQKRPQLTQWEGWNILKGFFFFFVTFLVCHGKLLPVHNLIKSKLFYLLEIWRYEQNKGEERP